LAEEGIALGLYGNRYLRHDGPEHVLAVAPTRSGKGVGLVLPTLLTWTGSAVIHDIKGENWQLTAGWRARGSRCLLFDPTSQDSARFNPLLEVRKGAHEVRDVQNIADILVDPEGMRERRDHWDKTAHALLTGAILHVLYAEQEKTLARVASFLADPSRSTLRTLKVMLFTNHLGTDEAPMAHPVVASVARELLNKSDNERSGVVSTAMSFLGLYRDPIIAANTASSPGDGRASHLALPGRAALRHLAHASARAPHPQPDRPPAHRVAARGPRRGEAAPAAHARRVPRARPARLLRDLAGLHGRLRRAGLPGRPVPAADRPGLRCEPRHPR
jgi:type IV secretory pathway TraG/TraD family ATPase VirD4